MDARQAFKFGFMSRCIDAGLTTPAEMLTVVKTAMDKSALGFGTMLGLEGAGKALDAAGSGIADVSKWGLGLAAVAPPIVGAIGGTLAAKATDISDYDVDKAKQQEVVDEYHRQAQRMRREGALRRFTQTQGGML